MIAERAVMRVVCRTTGPLLALLPLCAFAADWPNWRGPDHNGISKETGWRTDWPPRGPDRLWTAEVGQGYSSVSVAQGRLYTMGHRQGNDTVFCLDADTGRQVWAFSYACKLVNNLNDGGPGATPTVDGDRVYTLSKEGHLLCFDAVDGKGVWARMLEPLLDVPMPEWGFSCSPLIVGDALVVEAGRTASFDKRDGRLLWSTDKFNAGYGSPVAFDHQGVRLIAVLNADALLVLRASDGAIVDRFAWDAPYRATAATPVISGNTIFISAAYGKGAALVELSGGRLRTVYTNRAMNNQMATCVLSGGHLYGFNGQSQNARLCTLTCLDHATGSVKWVQRGLGTGTLSIADDKLILLGDQGQLVIARATPESFQPMAQAKVLDGLCWTVPVLANGKLYCRSAAGSLVCLDVSGR